MRLALAVGLAAMASWTPPAQAILHSVFVRVVDADTSRPLSGVEVVAGRRQGNAILGVTTHTDRNGRAWIRGLAPGRTAVWARHPGYFAANTTGESLSTIPVEIEDGALPPLVTIRLTRGAVVSGTILDEFGEPMAGVTVRLLSRRGWSRSLAASDTTDDRGQYRFIGLRPGEYVVGAAATYLPRIGATGGPAPGTSQPSPNDLQGWSGDEDLLSSTYPPLAAPAPGAPLVGYRPTFYPGVDMADATVIKADAGREYNSVMFALRAAPLGMASGQVVGRPDGAPARLAVVLVPTTGDDTAEPIPVAMSDIHDRFVTPFLPYGAYTLVATLVRQPGETHYSARMPVTIDAGSAAVPLIVTLERTSR